MKTLGIVIPTYNRVGWLKKALDVLMPLVRENAEDICVYVSDNASQDGTDSIMSYYLNEYTGLIEYHRHDKNSGYFFNFNYGIQNIQAKFVFLHGDDDVVTPYFIDFILNVLRKNDNLAWIHFNYFLSDIKRGKVSLFQNKMDLSHAIIYYEDGIKMIGEYLNGPSFMSANIFRREDWITNVESPEKSQCYGYEWLYVMFKGVLGKPSMYIRTPLFVQQFSGSNNYNKLWPLYSLVGIYKVFENLDSGLLEIWREYHCHTLKNEYYRSISFVYMDKSLYKAKFSELTHYMRKKDKFMTFLLIYVFPSFISKYFVSMPIRVFSKLVTLIK